MARQSLTAKFCEGARGTGKQVAYPDADVRGLEFRVSAEGQRSWSLRYRDSAGHQKRLSLGSFPAVPLVAARTAARRVKADVSEGKDPVGEKRKAKEIAKARPIKTFDDLVTDYFEACEAGLWMPKGKRKRASSLDSERGVYRRHLKEVLGDTVLDDLTRADVRRSLKGMVLKGIQAQTLKAQQVVRASLNYAVAQERLAINPALGLEAMASTNPRERVLTDDELRGLWKGLNEPASLRLPEGGKVWVSRPMAIAMMLATILLQRKSEVVGMEVSELNLDEGTWSIPGPRMKSGKPHMVPLPPRAVELIREALELAAFGRKERPAHVFPNAHDAERPMRGDSVTHCMASVTAALGIKGASPHDLRRTGATNMASERLGVQEHVVSKVLSHTDGGGGGARVTSAHYNLYAYAAEKRAALAAWENLLLEIVGERVRPDNVTQLPLAGAG